MLAKGTTVKLVSFKLVTSKYAAKRVVFPILACKKQTYISFYLQLSDPQSLWWFLQLLYTEPVDGISKLVFEPRDEQMNLPEHHTTKLW